ncbi:hypothetical protein COEREDRAFT_88022 [Coemansia reversa NRRL 1564]|uniref:Uncharacterized protein n=1 Tax=Coemansia reversa (strain ATCC 12441 / NRRL 1564) TaxID=763665 RepID=A0A2G5B848_COERN|nr:hypothetical protein COEREDRAFT_88022 [Coemansia reversa NRRL 1564]|eukprot:PIA15162.1 hypothetical protein COEREDRAFT_88022 [Coemansia reversa NRRL 1564]
MHSRLKLTKGSKIKNEKSKHKHYKRVHEDENLEGNNDNNSSNQNTFLPPAAENDNLGWKLDTEYFDPMYTINRRNRENNVKDKDAFFKKLRMRLESTSADTSENISKSYALGHDKALSESPATATKGESKEDSDTKTPVTGLMGFGFGMMGNVINSQQSATKQVKAKKKSKDRKDKEKKKSKKSLR